MFNQFFRVVKYAHVDCVNYIFDLCSRVRGNLV